MGGKLWRGSPHPYPLPQKGERESGPEATRPPLCPTPRGVTLPIQGLGTIWPTEMESCSRSSILSMRPSRIQTTRSDALSILKS